MANCFEARRLWTRRTLLVLFLVTLAIAVVAPALGLVSRYVLRHPPGPMFLRFASRLALVAFPPRVHLCAGVLLPMCRLSIGGTVALVLSDMGAPSGPGGVELVSEPVRMAIDSAFQALIFAGVWFAAKCALTEGAE